MNKLSNYIPVLMLITLIGCGQQTTISIHEKPNSMTTEDSLRGITVKKPDTFSISGDFDGDGHQDQLTYVVADSTGKEVSEIIDIAQNDWDSVLVYSKRHSLRAQLTVNGRDTGIDTGVSMGILSLINIGDNNGDGKDEVALVPLLQDYSNLNSCRIWSVCNGNWKLLTTFGINELAFFEESVNQSINPASIPGYLEKQNGKWMFLDYYKIEQMPDDQYGKLQKLSVPSCP